MTDRLSNQRALFNIPEDVVYLNCASQGPLMQQTCDAGHEGVLRKAKPWDQSMRARTLDEIESCRAVYGNLVGAEADDIAILLLGYEKEMRDMLDNQNPGLKRRFDPGQAFVFESS